MSSPLPTQNDRTTYVVTHLASLGAAAVLSIMGVALVVVPTILDQSNLWRVLGPIMVLWIASQVGGGVLLCWAIWTQNVKLDAAACALLVCSQIGQASAGIYYGGFAAWTFITPILALAAAYAGRLAGIIERGIEQDHDEQRERDAS